MPFIKHTENRLYHYCKFKTAKDYILPSNNLLLNSIVKTNDPRENKHFVFDSVYRGMTLLEVQKKNEEVNVLLRKNCKALCFSQDYLHRWGCASSQMWAHYGGNHTGVCLELDMEEFIKENPTLDVSLFRKVTYVDYKIRTAFDPPNNNPFDHKEIDYTTADKMGLENYVLSSFRPQHLNYFYFTKNIEWESERERRVIHFGDYSGR